MTYDYHTAFGVIGVESLARRFLHLLLSHFNIQRVKRSSSFIPGVSGTHSQRGALRDHDITENGIFGFALYTPPTCGFFFRQPAHTLDTKECLSCFSFLDWVGNQSMVQCVICAITAGKDMVAGFLIHIYLNAHSWFMGGRCPCLQASSSKRNKCFGCSRMLIEKFVRFCTLCILM